MRKLRKVEGSCAVVALHYVSGADEETVLRVCKLHGFEEGQGMEDDEWRDAAVNLGLKVRSVAISPVKLSKFLRDRPTGLYLVGTFDHLFVIDNGVIVDPRCENPPGLSRIIKQAWRVYRI